jgi:hypothetical protein
LPVVYSPINSLASKSVNFLAGQTTVNFYSTKKKMAIQLLVFK